MTLVKQALDEPKDYHPEDRPEESDPVRIFVESYKESDPVRIFVESYKDGSLTDIKDWEQVVIAILNSAGFEELVTVTPGECRGNYLDQDGSATGETYSVNPYSKLIVYDQSPFDDEKPSVDSAATQWLDRICRDIKQRDLKDAASYVLFQCMETRPLEPILLNAFNERLLEYPPNHPMGKHTRDHDELGSCIGIHDICRGWVDLKHISRTHHAIVCRSCGLRVVIPVDIQTYGQLRGWLAT
ncbi:hypothetical protein GF380_00015 [Candidatus Uhrbacteria bacterium]|nr:hypothetical protein [Candidatus Uhrbacteria bacterium]MBD3283810.1 hypothetical protein [Candidatus Uhrbacteria bacterium]